MKSVNRFEMNLKNSMPPAEETTSGDLCIPNISSAERRKRLMFGVGVFVLGLVVLAAMLALGLSRWWRLALLPLFGMAGSGFFQWRDKT